jgi:RHS repeat-associated protein
MRSLTAVLHFCLNSFARVLVAVSFVLLLAATAAAQSPTDGSTPSGFAPGSPAGSYALSDFDTVNLYNGSLNIRLPLLDVGGRGYASYPITLHVEKKWTVHKHLEPGVGAFYFADSGWWSEEGEGLSIFSAGKVDIRSAHREQPTGYPVETLTRITFTAPDGTEYELRDQLTNGQPVPPQTGGFNRGHVFVTADGTAATFYADLDIYDDPTNGQGFYNDRPAGYMLLADGTRFRVEDGKIVWMRDRNGNKVSFSYDLYRRVTLVTDSLGRQVTITYPASGVTYILISFTGFGGATRTIKIGQTNLWSTGTLRSDFSTQTIGQLFPELNGGGPVDSTVINYVELPDGRRYQFQYDSYAEVARVVLPTGGAVEYDYAAGLTDGAASGVFSIGTEKYIYRRVIERRIYPDGGSGSAYASKMTYSRPETNSANAGYVVTEQCTPSGSLGLCGTGASRLDHSRHYFYGSPRASFGQKPTAYAAYKDGREYKTELFDANATTPLRRAEQTFAQRAAVSWWTGDPELAPPNDVRTTDTVTTLTDANLVSKQTFSYDQFNNKTDVYDYDYNVGAPGGLLRRTHTDYVTTNTVGGVTYDYACSRTTTCSNESINANVIHLRTLTSQQWVSTDAAGSSKVSLTTYAYDQSGLTDRAPITGMCTTFPNAVCASANSTAYVTRGNPTGVTRYANAAAGTGALNTTAAYDIAGNIVSKTDPKGYTTQTTYGDSFCNGSTCGAAGYTPNTYAFAMSTTLPVPDVSTAYGYQAGTFGSTYALTTSKSYDFYTSLTYSTTDANNKTTTVEYNDLLNRPTAQIRPDGSRTDVQYNDTVGNLYVRVLTDLDATRRTETRQYFDGFGRPYRSLTYENQDSTKPWLTAESQYDALGRVVKESLPFRSTGGATPLTPAQWSDAKRTETEYDSLGRVKKAMTMPDGAAVTTSLVGNTTTVTDQMSRGRKSVCDALGRLKQVYEDPSGLNYLTSYTYDALSNVGTVTQGTQTRSFVYDSLGRMTSSTSPEGGATGYTYDANSNLETKADARGVTTTYRYDRLNRNIITTYTGGTPTTPDARRYYDGATNGKGRLYWTEVANFEAEVFDSYDALGRPTQYHQVYNIGGTWGQPFYVSRSYNKAGGVTSQTYPSGHVVGYNFDAAGRIADYNGQAAFGGNLGDGAQRTYASEVRYQEMGGREQERFGADTPVYNKSLYNSRGQLAEMRVSTYSITAAGHETDWNRGAIISHYSLAAGAWGATGGGPDNNGNLLKQDIYIPTSDDVNSGFSQSTQFYDYDALNRLYQARESYGGSNIWVQYFNYDRWGNRTINAANTTGSAPEPQFTVDTSTNRLGVPAGQSGVMTYDPAGNLTNDTYQGGLGGGGTRTYDAENRMTSAQFISGGLQTASYTYDADGRRVKRNVGAGGEVWQVYGVGGELLAEYAANAAPTSPQREYGYRGGELLVTADAGVAPSAPAVGNAGFEAPAVGGGSFQYGPSGTTWTMVNGAGVSGNSSAFTSGNPAAPEGSQVAFLQVTGSISQQVSGFQPGATYRVRFYAAQRGNGNNGGQDFQILIDATSLGAFRPAGTSYVDTATTTFTATAATHALKFQGVDSSGGDNTAFIDNVRIELVSAAPPPTPANAGFEVPAVGGGQFQYSPSSGTWAFVSAGVSGNSSGFTSGNPGAPEGSQVAFIQGGPGAYISQSVSNFQAGVSYTVTFKAAQRGNGNNGGQDFDLYLDSTLLGTYRPSGTAYQQMSATFTTTAGTHTLKLVGRNSSGGDNTAFIDDVRIAGTAAAGVRWMVTDQLGTPRMIVGQTGMLSGVTRHDYLPFGEEVPTDANWRTAARGYVGDGVRQKFTAYEHDAETGLDFALARYYASAQGRFAGADPVLIDGKRQVDPQMLNLYAYARNNPLKYTDPSGMEVYVDGDRAATEAYISSLNSRGDGKQFKVANIGGRVTIVDDKGKELSKAAKEALAKNLSGGEAELFKALTDTNTCAVIHAGSMQSNDQVTFGQNASEAGTGPAGVNTLDMPEMKLLDASENKGQGGLSSGDAVAHETVEAYLTATGMKPNDAHNRAAGSFGSLETPPKEFQLLAPPPDSSGYFHNGTVDYPVYKPGGTWMRMHATVRFSQGIKPGVTQSPPRFNITGVKIVRY